MRIRLLKCLLLLFWIMAYVCHCGRTFDRGTALANHKRSQHGPAAAVQITPPADGAEPAGLLFDGSNLPDPADWPAAGDEDLGPPDSEVAPPPPLLPPGQKYNLLLTEYAVNGNGGKGCSAADVNTVCRLMKGVAEDCCAGLLTAGELLANDTAVKRYVDVLSTKYPSHRWHSTEVFSPSFPNLPGVGIIYRDAEQVLKALVAKLPIQQSYAPEFTLAGERLYRHPCSADFQQARQAFWAEQSPELVPLIALLLQLWSDKANLTLRGNFTFYPLNMAILNIPHEFLLPQYMEGPIAFLPVLDRTSMAPGLDDDDWSIFQAEILCVALERVLFPLLDAGHQVKCIDHLGAEFTAVCAVGSYPSDIPERAMLCGHIGGASCDKCFVTQPDMLPIRGQADAALRTANRSAAIRKQMALFSPANRAILRTTSRCNGALSFADLLYERGEMSFLADWAPASSLISRLVPGDIFALDTLHAVDEGTTKRLLNMTYSFLVAEYGTSVGNWLTGTMALRYDEIRGYAFIENTKWPASSGLFAPKGKGGKEAGVKVQACEMRALLQIWPMLMPGILGTLQPDGSWRAAAFDDDHLTQAVAAHVLWYMELRRCHRSPGHTERTLGHVSSLALNATEALSPHLLDHQTSKCATPKHHSSYGPHVGRGIRISGTLEWHTTEFGEGSIKVGKAAYSGTSKHTATANFEMALRLERRATIYAEMAALQLSAKPPAQGSRSNATVQASESGMNALAATTAYSFTISQCSESPLPDVLSGCHGMTAFPSALLRHLNESRDAANQLDCLDPLMRISLVNTGTVAACMPHVPAAQAKTLLRVYCSYNLYHRVRLSFVYVPGVENGVSQQWIGQALAMGRLPGGKEFIFIQFLVQDPELSGKGHLFSIPGATPLVWERVGNNAYSYAVLPFADVISRAFVVPNVSNIYAAPTVAMRRREAKARTERSRKELDRAIDSSDDEPGIEDVRVLMPTKMTDVPESRWPNWIVNPFVEGWDK